LAGIIGLIISDKKVALTTKLKLFYLAATYLWICLRKKINSLQETYGFEKPVLR
tara:strand:- start:138 stop:299 length:162 start_codon:yes stop_codon:yes gene_type:complete